MTYLKNLKAFGLFVGNSDKNLEIDGLQIFEKQKMGKMVVLMEHLKKEQFVITGRGENIGSTMNNSFLQLRQFLNSVSSHGVLSVFIGHFCLLF